MDGLRRPTTSVKAAAIVAILGSVLVLLGAAFVFLTVLLLPGVQTGAELPRFARVVAQAAMVFFFGFAILGLFTGVGVLRLEKWARISMLIWSGLTAAFCALTISSLFIPIPIPPSTPGTPANFMSYVRVAIVLFYGVPLAIAVWWLVLFNSKVVIAQFLSPGTGAMHDPSGFPIAPPSSKPELPLPIIVLAGFMLLSSIGVFFSFFMRVPLILFARALRGPVAIAVWIAICLIATAAGIGLLRRKRWSYGLTIALQVLGLLNGIVTLVSSRYPDLMREAIASMPFTNGVYPEYSIEQLRVFSYMGLAFPVFVLILLLYYRARFLQACEG